MKVRIK